MVDEPVEAQESPPPLTQKEKIALFFLPNIGDIIFILVLQIPLFTLPHFIFGDGSTGWHLYTGDYILNTHQIPHQDLISYTHPTAPWVAYEWFSDLLMALAVKFGGFNLLGVWVSCAISWLLAMLYGRCRKEGVHFSIALILTLIGTIVSAVHWLARPVLFTFYGVYFFSTRLEDFFRGEIGKKQLLIVLPLFTLLWVNTHPGFLFGFALLTIYIFSAIACMVYYAGTDKYAFYLDRFKWMAAAGVACLFAAMLNPYGAKLYIYISEYLKGSWVVAVTDEFKSPIFHGTLQPVCLELLFAAFITGLAISTKRLSLPRLLTCIAFGHLTLSAVRNMPLYAIVVVPAISQLLSSIALPAAVRSDGKERKFDSLRKRWTKMSALFDENEALCNKHIWPVVIFVVLTIVASNGGHMLGIDINSGWNPKDKPVKTVEYLRAEEASGRLDPNRGFNYDNWGGFLLYNLKTRVFIDDRADFHGEKFYTQYSILSMVQPGWEKLLDEFHIQWVLMPKNSRLAAALHDDPHWRLGASDEASTLYVRKD